MYPLVRVYLIRSQLSREVEHMPAISCIVFSGPQSHGGSFNL